MRRTFITAALGMLISATATFAQDEIGQVNGRFDQTQNSISDLQQSLSGTNDVQRDAIVQSLQAIITQLQSQQGTSVQTGMAPIQSSTSYGAPMNSQPYYSGQAMTTYSAPIEQSYAPAMTYSAPMMQAPIMEAPVMQAPVMQAPIMEAPAFIESSPAPQQPINVNVNVVAPPAPAPVALPPAPQPQSYVEYGPVFQMPRPQPITVMVPVLVPIQQQQQKRHGCRLFHH